MGANHGKTRIAVKESPATVKSTNARGGYDASATNTWSSSGFYSTIPSKRGIDPSSKYTADASATDGGYHSYNRSNKTTAPTDTYDQQHPPTEEHQFVEMTIDNGDCFSSTVNSHYSTHQKHHQRNFNQTSARTSPNGQHPHHSLFLPPNHHHQHQHQHHHQPSSSSPLAITNFESNKPLPDKPNKSSSSSTVQPSNLTNNNNNNSNQKKTTNGTSQQQQQQKPNSSFSRQRQRQRGDTTNVRLVSSGGNNFLTKLFNSALNHNSPAKNVHVEINNHQHQNQQQHQQQTQQSNSVKKSTFSKNKKKNRTNTSTTAGPGADSKKAVYENLYSEAPMQSVVLEDVAPSTSLANEIIANRIGGGAGSSTLNRRREPKLIKEQFDARLLAQYDIKALIGKGSFSRVVRGIDRKSGETYAIKLVSAINQNAGDPQSPPHPSSSSPFGPFENELNILSRIHHPNVVRLHQVIRSSARIYMVLELATGGELYERIVAKGRFTERETAITIGQMTRGLEYLHRIGITHRDLKPENLLYTKNPDSSTSSSNEVHSSARLLITDFGLACQARSQDDRMTETCGTPEYIAPEVLMRFPYNCKVDLWSVGVICYILLSGIMPFDSESRTRLYRQIIRGKYEFYPEFWSTVSVEAKGFVMALLETDPGDRLTADECLRYPWLLAHTTPHTQSSSSINNNNHHHHHHNGGKTVDNNSNKKHYSYDGSSMAGGVAQKTGKQQVMTMMSMMTDNNGGPTILQSSSQPQQPQAPPASTRFQHQHSHSPGPVSRTRSSRSIRSVARSDHTHRVKPQEVDRLLQDPELRRFVYERNSRRSSSKKPTNRHVLPGPTVVRVPSNSALRRPDYEKKSGSMNNLSNNNGDFCIVGVSSSSTSLPRHKLPRQHSQHSHHQHQQHRQQQHQQQHQSRRETSIKNYGLV